MKTSDTVNLLFAAIAEAQGQFPSVKKDETATTEKYAYNYATLAGHVEAAKPHLRANGLAVLQEVVTNDHAEGANITTRIVHKSGEWIEFDPLFVPANKWDAQGLGSAITYGRRYTFSASVGTVPDEDDDASSAVQTLAPRPAKAEAPPATVVDTATGEEVATTAGLPPAPEGYFYVTGYALTRGWHEATLLGWDAQGGPLKVSTKTKTGEALKAAQDAGVPVKVKTRDKGKPGEAYLDDAQIWKPKPGPRPVAPKPVEPAGEMLDDSQIPF